MTAAGRGWRTWLAGLGGSGLTVDRSRRRRVHSRHRPVRLRPCLFVIVLLPVVLGLGGLVLLAALFGVIPAAAAVRPACVIRRKASPAGGGAGGDVSGRDRGVDPAVLRWVAAAIIVPLGVGSLLGRRHRAPRRRTQAETDGGPWLARSFIAAPACGPP